MDRVAILIGVNQVNSNSLRQLSDAVSGVEAMVDWAAKQKIKCFPFTDCNKKKVRISDITQVVDELLDVNKNSVPEQLIIYFAGHGVNSNYNEYWFLSEAPKWGHEAINVAGSILRARSCGIKNVVFISDACRTAAGGIIQGAVEGTSIFPALSGRPPGTVDVFYACSLGDPAHEIKDPQITAHEFKALYTSELVPALKGYRPEVIDWDNERRTGFVRHHALDDWMRVAVKARLKNLNLTTRVIQRPEAIISSRESALPWLSRFDQTPARDVIDRLASTPVTFRGSRGTSKNIEKIQQELLSSETGAALKEAGFSTLKQVKDFAETTAALSRAFPGSPYERSVRFRVRGGQFRSRLLLHEEAEIVSGLSDTIRFDMDAWCAPTLLTFKDGSGTILPAMKDFTCLLTLVGDRLIEVAYEPCADTKSAHAYERKQEQMRYLRGVSSASMLHGLFNVPPETIMKFIKGMHYDGIYDPTAALYSAYALYELQQSELLVSLQDILSSSLTAPWFDIELLSGSTLDEPILPSLPSLARGWALLSARELRLPGDLKALHTQLQPSPWTSFSRAGIEMIRHAIHSRGIGGTLNG